MPEPGTSGPRSIAASVVVAIALLLTALTSALPTGAEPGALFPRALVDWVPYPGNPLFSGSGGDTWDHEIRERGYILREEDAWKLWYTGYDSRRDEVKLLGYATSPDGISWTRDPANPIFATRWTEDVFVLRRDGGYLMLAEGRGDVAHRLTSADGRRWRDRGDLDIRARSGEPLSPGPYGTPTLWVEKGTWYLFYERDDKGIWLATSTDGEVFTNVSDDPVIALGPDSYDLHAVALNQVVRVGDHYYGVYHANADPEWKGPWTTCLAASDDLVHWTKYPGNPIINEEASSGILVDDGTRRRLYTMHPEVRLWLPRGDPLVSAPTRR